MPCKILFVFCIISKWQSLSKISVGKLIKTAGISVWRQLWGTWGVAGEPNLGSLPKQEAHLTTEPALHPQHSLVSHFFLFIIEKVFRMDHMFMIWPNFSWDESDCKREWSNACECPQQFYYWHLSKFQMMQMAINKWIDKLWHVCTMRYYPAIKNSELPHGSYTTYNSMDESKNTSLSERTQRRNE